MPTAHHQSGFTYFTVLFIVAFMGVGMAFVGQQWHTVAVREREAELLQVGNQYRKAIERYYRNGPGQYPRSLADLLKDPRKPGVERYLRRTYGDPVTGKDEWGILKGPDGGVMGIYSLSEGKPLKRTNFRASDKDFENAAKYSEWKFIYLPLGPTAPQPGAQPLPGTPGTPVPGQTAPGIATPGGTSSPAPGTASTPFTTQAVPGAATPGGSLSPGPTSPPPSPGGPMSPGTGAPGFIQTQPFLSTQPEPGGTTAR